MDSCANVNFAFRGVCNRCGTGRPAGVSSGGGGVAGRGRGRAATDSAGLGRGATGRTGLFGPNDWPCPMCGNINWPNGQNAISATPIGLGIMREVQGTMIARMKVKVAGELLAQFEPQVCLTSECTAFIVLASLRILPLCALSSSSIHMGGRGGGYKELDEEELEEMKWRRREAEEARDICCLLIIGMMLHFISSS
ncbi:hypothetical protein Cgig2_003029 [Carnegiea gigantea]|uniref:Uncharacterized protein n=1 Tax=Carnegiea gigantea TaxID=171969 RepID=A0A9Q1JNL5_9CARY|nr:hypothetical protein Cgig2_003029 [Carnegiea gigantea]